MEPYPWRSTSYRLGFTRGAQSKAPARRESDCPKQLSGGVVAIVTFDHTEFNEIASIMLNHIRANCLSSATFSIALIRLFFDQFWQHRHHPCDMPTRPRH